MTNTELFSGKAHAYADARPGYPDEVMEYITALVPHDAVFADIGAGTGKFTTIIARYGYEVFAVEPNADMRELLANELKQFLNAKIVPGTAEVTMLPDNSVDVMTCAQALHWFDPEGFREECKRIGKPGYIVIGIHNVAPGEDSVLNGSQGTHDFFKAPVVKEFPNPIYYTRDSWVNYMLSHSKDPLPSDPEYVTHIEKVNAIFDRDNVDGLLRRDVVSKVYCESSNIKRA